MAANSITSPFPIITDIDGQPLEGGYIWIGIAGLDPQTNPKNTYWDNALTALAAQPIRTIGGYPIRTGSPARLFVDANYSIRVQNKNGTIIYSSLVSTNILSADQVTFTGPDGLNYVLSDLADNSSALKGDALIAVKQPLSGSVARTQHDKNAEQVSILDFGATPGSTEAQNKTALQLAIASVDAGGGGVITVPESINYGYKRTDLTTHPDLSACINIVIIEDYSIGNSYAAPGRDGAQLRRFFHTPGETDGNHDGNTIWHRGKWHPSILISNDANYAAKGDPSRTALDNRRATIITAIDGDAQWQIGQGGTSGDLTDDELSNFIIACYGNYGGVAVGATQVMTVDRVNAAIGFNNTPPVGYNFDFAGKINRTHIVRFLAPLVNNTALYFSNANGIRFSMTVNDDLSVSFGNNVTNYMFIGSDKSLFGHFTRVEHKTTSYPVTANDNQKILSNNGAGGGFIFTLPLAVPGMELRFYVASANNMRVDPNNSDQFRAAGLGKYKESSTVGSKLKLVCIVANIWEFEESGTWATEP